MSTPPGSSQRGVALPVILLLLVDPRLGPAAPPTTSREVVGVPSDQELEALGAVIGEIYINNENIFNLENPDDNTALFRLADQLHIKTRAGVVRNELLFHSGDRYSRRLLDESERILRGNQYFYDAWILPVSYHDGKVDLRVTTRDVWTLDPGFRFGRSGGENSTGVQLQELNLLGTGGVVAVGHTRNVDRDQSTISFSHDNLFGSWVSVSGSYTDASDGVVRFFDVERPFYSLDAHHAAGVLGQTYDQIDNLYDRGRIVDEFRDHSRYFQAYGGWSQGLKNGWVQRWTVGVTYDEHAFTPLPLPISTLLPEDRKFLYPWLRYELLQDAFVRTMNHDQIQRTEDFFLGTSLSLQLGLTSRSLGSSRDTVQFRTRAGRGFGDVDHTLLLLSGSFNGWLEDGTLHNTVLTGAIRYYVKMSDHLLFFSALSGTRSWRLELDQQLLLGGDSGLRGYPLRYQDGTTRGLLTIEERYFTDWYLFRLFRVGAAIFFDMGRTWGQPLLAQPSLGMLKDVGVGLRFGNARSGLGNVVHVDLAFPLNGDPSIDRVQVLIQTEAQF